MRLVPGQDFKKIAKLFEKHFKAIAPKSVKVKVKFLHGGMPYVAPTDMPAYKAAEKAIADTFGKKPLRSIRAARFRSSADSKISWESSPS